jgi:uncharacterized SAM-binding protein YcdF (DUF218 family)
MHELLFWLLWNPLPVLLFLLGVALANLWRKRREERRRLLAITAPYLLLVLFSTPAFVYYCRGLLEWQYPPLRELPEGVEAIVVLGSSVQREAEAPGGFLLDEHARNRCECAAGLYRRGKPLPVLVSGGRAAPDEPACAVFMRDYLVELGVPATDIIVESQANDTYENAIESGRILDERALRKVVLVTDASHLVRAVRCFRKCGIDTVGCGCHYQSTPDNPGRKIFWPHPAALKTWPAVCYEWLALPWYWVRGRI